MMRLAIVYYSKTGNTLKIVNTLREALMSMNISVDVYKVLPLNEYSKPLHLNPRILYDIFIRRGTRIKIEPRLLDINKYEYVIVASPIWFNTLSPPIQEFLKRYKLEEKVMVIVTSVLDINCLKIERVFKELCSNKPIFCINITTKIIRDEQKLRQYIYVVVKRISGIIVEK